MILYFSNRNGFTVLAVINGTAGDNQHFVNTNDALIGRPDAQGNFYGEEDLSKPVDTLHPFLGSGGDGEGGDEYLSGTEKNQKDNGIIHVIMPLSGMQVVIEPPRKFFSDISYIHR